jgi:hypothetical protein
MASVQDLVSRLFWGEQEIRGVGGDVAVLRGLTDAWLFRMDVREEQWVGVGFCTVAVHCVVPPHGYNNGGRLQQTYFRFKPFVLSIRITRNKFYSDSFTLPSIHTTNNWVIDYLLLIYNLRPVSDFIDPSSGRFGPYYIQIKLQKRITIYACMHAYIHCTVR